MDLFTFIKDQIDIISVISEYTNIKKTGSMYWKGLCPFHHEKTPSFSVSPHKKIFYCFGCHETGDVINFIEKIENISAFEAAKHLADRYNLDIPEEITKNSCKRKKEKTPYKLYQLVSEWCNNKLLKSNVALNYIKKRKISEKTVKSYSIGYFPSGSSTIKELLSHLMHNGFSSSDLLSEYILFQGRGALYSPFENRLIFPIKNHMGQGCGFGGRILNMDDQRPKYYNSKETGYFKKGKILFGLDIAKKEIQKKKRVFVVEGYTDCIAMHQHGYKNTVATLGTACSADHLKQLEKHAETIYILFDGDKAGKQAALRLTKLCWQLELELKVIMIPENQDPASILEKNENLDDYIKNSLDIFIYFLKSTGINYNRSSMKEKISAVNSLLDLIVNIKDDLKKNILLIKASEMIEVPLDILKKEYNNKVGNKIEGNSEKNSSEKNSSSLDQQIISAIYHDPTIVKREDEILLSEKLNEPIKSIFEKIMENLKKNGSTIKGKNENFLTINEQQFLSQALFSIETINIEQTFANLMTQFRKKHWRSLLSYIKIKLLKAKESNNKEEMMELINVFQNLKKIFIK